MYVYMYVVCMYVGDLNNIAVVLIFSIMTQHHIYHKKAGGGALETDLLMEIITLLTCITIKLKKELVSLTRTAVLGVLSCKKYIQIKNLCRPNTNKM